MQEGAASQRVDFEEAPFLGPEEMFQEKFKRAGGKGFQPGGGEMELTIRKKLLQDFWTECFGIGWGNG